MSLFRRSLKAHILNATPGEEVDRAIGWSYASGLFLCGAIIALIILLVAVR